MSLTLFNVGARDSTLRQIRGRMARRPLARTVARPEGGDVALRTAAGGMKTDADGNLHAAITDESLDEYTAPGGDVRSVVRTSTIGVVFTADVRHLLVLAGKAKADPIAAKVSQIAFEDLGDAVTRCSIPADRLDGFIRDHDARIMQCSWRDLNIPSLSGANLVGAEIGGGPDFQRYDAHGSKHSVRIRLPAMGMTLSINRHASAHFFTAHDLDEQIRFAREHLAGLCR